MTTTLTEKRVPGIRIAYDAKRVDKGWGVFIDLRLNGKRYAPSKFFAARAEAELAYASAVDEVTRMRAEAARETGLKKALALPPLPSAPKGVALFETMALRWLRDHVKVMCTPASYKNYKRLLTNHLLPIMRTWPMTGETMSGERVKDVLKRQLAEQGVRLPTRRACHTTLRACFGWAKGELPPSAKFDGHVLDDMGRYLRNANEKHIDLTGQPNPMTRTQVEAFLAYQQTHYPDLYEWYVWLADQGSRISEVAALKWEHLDLDRGKAHIVEAFSWAQLWMDYQEGRDTSVGEKDTKTHRKNQYIDLSDRVRDLFPALRARNREAWFATGRYRKEPRHCFVTQYLTPRRPDNSIYRSFRAACTALGLIGQTGKPFTIHCLRDTFATLAILSGKPLGWVSMMLGHSNQRTTEMHYYRWVRLVEKNPLAGEQSGGAQ